MAECTHTLIDPSASHSVSFAYRATPSLWFGGVFGIPYALTTFLSATSLSSLISEGKSRTSVPPGASASYARFCVSARDTESNTVLIGAPPVAFLTSARIASAGRLRSMTCVAPNSFSASALCREAVVMIGLNPASLASWIAGDRGK